MLVLIWFMKLLRMVELYMTYLMVLYLINKMLNRWLDCLKITLKRVLIYLLILKNMIRENVTLEVK
jgi:hypothetical protein